MSATQNLLRFGVFELNLDTEELRKSGTVIKLPPQPWKLLALLASRAGQVVSRDEIQQQLWEQESKADVDVENMVNKCIKQIRTVLSDNADRPLYIETLPRHGYRFIAPVVSKVIAAPRPRVVSSDSGEREHIAVLRGSAAPATVTEAVGPSYPAAVLEPEAASPDIAESRSRFRRGRLVWIEAAVVLILLIGGGLYWRAHRRRPALTDKDTIVLADFDNKTGDPVFTDTLKQGLAIQLEQSPFLALLSQGKVNRTLRLMDRSTGDPLTPEVAREVCQRTGSKAMLTGSIAALGNQYVIGLKAVNCNSGDTLAETQEEAAGKEAVLKALDRAAVSLRSKLGESLSTVQKYATPLSETTTPSLEALEAYSQGKKIWFSQGTSAALPLFKRAVELDPNFAVAYVAIAGAYSQMNETKLAEENARKAHELAQKVSDRERFFIDGTYYLLVTGELDRALQVFQQWQQAYPREYSPYVNLVSIYAALGKGDEAMETARQAIQLEPNNGTNYLNLGSAYISRNRLKDAGLVYKEAEQRKLQGEFLLQSRYVLAFLAGDAAKMQELAAAAEGKAGTEDLLLASQADTAAWSGKFKNARELTQRAMDSAQHNEGRETAATYEAAAALREAESGLSKQALADAEAALKLAPDRNVRILAALALARAGDATGAEKLVSELDKTFPLDTLVQEYWLPTIRAAIALDRNKPERAVELLAVTSALELSQPAPITVSLCPVYLRGEAYLLLRDGKAANAEFQKVIDHYGLVANFPWGALARLGLARAYALEGLTDPAAREKARTAYQNFLTLWKDADPDISIYRQAKTEYAKLR